ncbi:30975_t:CDS:2, partial [Racocetra persica]
YHAESISLGHPAIKLAQSETDEKAQKETYYLVMEYANNGNLREYLRNNKLEWPEKIPLTSQIAEGMFYLHKIDIIHRDLHTANILIHNEDVKISDFGFSKNLNTTAVTSSKELYGVIPFIDP